MLHQGPLSLPTRTQVPIGPPPPGAEFRGVTPAWPGASVSTFSRAPRPLLPSPGTAWKHSEKRRDHVLSSERGPGDGKPGLTLVRQARPWRLTQVAWRGAGRASPAGEQRGSFGSELRENSTPRPKGESKASLLKRGYHSREGGVLSEAPGESPSARRPAREYRVRREGQGEGPQCPGNSVYVPLLVSRNRSLWTLFICFPSMAGRPHSVAAPRVLRARPARCSQPQGVSDFTCVGPPLPDLCLLSPLASVGNGALATPTDITLCPPGRMRG